MQSWCSAWPTRPPENQLWTIPSPPVTALALTSTEKPTDGGVQGGFQHGVCVMCDGYRDAGCLTFPSVYQPNAQRKGQSFEVAGWLLQGQGASLSRRFAARPVPITSGVGLRNGLEPGVGNSSSTSPQASELTEAGYL